MPQLTIPLLRASEYLELPPILTYAGAALWNFSCLGDDFSKLEDLRTLLSFTGTESESWFLLISVAIEAQSAGIVRTMMGAIESTENREYHIVIDALNDLRRCIQRIDALLGRMCERCDPMVFYSRVRPFLSGGEALPNGIFYDEGNGKGNWRKLHGGSNGQSSLIQFFDIILGVKHSGIAGEKSFHVEAREYMPGPHRRFLMHVAHISNIREVALRTPITDEQSLLRDAYTAATEALSNLRNTHLQIVARYIIVPSKQKWNGRQQCPTSHSLSQKQVIGTGGTIPVPLLKKARDDTCRAARLVN